MTATLLVGDIHERQAELIARGAKFDLIITSPPFYNLRSYLPDDHPDKHLEIGSERTPADWMDTMLALTGEWRRLLAPHGSIAVEIGDCYAGSGGAGGDYDEDGLRAGQPKFRADWSRSGVLEQSLVGIPHAYALSLTLGRNIYRNPAPPSPAGQWMVRNYKSWIRTNPPVGALGRKERPATSYITVATLSRDRWFDLDAVRTAPNGNTHRRTAQGVDQIDRVGKSADRGGNWASLPEQAESGGAPPLDWWHQVDAIIDNELQQRAASARESHRENGSPKDRAAFGTGANNAMANRTFHARAESGARGYHIRRALERAGILTTQDALDISPRGYSGSHYAVFPAELVQQLVDEMCPRRVCTVCGKPSVRETSRNGTLDPTRPQARRAMELAEAAGLTEEHFAAIRSFGIHDAGKAKVTQTGAGKNSDRVKQLAGEAKAVLGGYFREYLIERPKTNRWSDCGHNDWRPGRILDPFSGSGTTLAVATGMGRDSVGIDLDLRNAHLTEQRCGMFLTVDWGHLEPTDELPPQEIVDAVGGDLL